MVKVAIEGGHAFGTPGKRSPDDEREWSFNNKVVLAAIEKLNIFENVQILRLDDPTGQRDVPLKERTDKANAWGADVLVSVHHNAHMGVWGSHGGVETYVHPAGSRASYDIADILQPRITTAMGLRDRGVKQLNLHMLRESNMPAVLTEGGFMDSTTDIRALRSDTKLKAQGAAIADGLARHFNLTSTIVDQASKPKPTPSTPAPSNPKLSTSTSIVDYLNSLKINSSAANRKKLAVEYGVKNYDLSAAKNTELLNKMRAGKPATVTTPKPTASTYKGSSLVDYLNSIKTNSGFANRVKLAKQYGINNYSGTAAQNTTLLNKLRSGSVASKPATVDVKIGSVVDWLKANKIDSSFTNRAKLAAQHGIKNYSGTAAQNTQLLNKLR